VNAKRALQRGQGASVRSRSGSSSNSVPQRAQKREPAKCSAKHRGHRTDASSTLQCGQARTSYPHGPPQEGQRSISASPEREVILALPDCCAHRRQRAVQPWSVRSKRGGGGTEGVTGLAGGRVYLFRRSTKDSPLANRERRHPPARHVSPGQSACTEGSRVAPLGKRHIAGIFDDPEASSDPSELYASISCGGASEDAG
jgi:hypothetical protein